MGVGIRTSPRLSVAVLEFPPLEQDGHLYVTVCHENEDADCCLL